MRDKTTIVVFDAAPKALADMCRGQIDAMVVQNPYQMGQLSVKLMKALVEGRPQGDPRGLSGVRRRRPANSAIRTATSVIPSCGWSSQRQVAAESHAVSPRRRSSSISRISRSGWTSGGLTSS